MTKRMLVDASHAEETRVVVLDGHRLEEFDLEAANRLPLKGNIYLARVVRVEPSLQAAFVEYGGNRHGFLAFGEIHPDYYQIPVADRQRLLAMQAAEAREADEAEEAAAARPNGRRPRREPASGGSLPPPTGRRRGAKRPRRCHRHRTRK
jgi:ribonuclease E